MRRYQEYKIEYLFKGQAFGFDAVVAGLPISEGDSRSSDNDQSSEEIVRLDHLSKDCRTDKKLTE